VSTKKASTEACQVSGLKASDNAVSFERQDQALPMPIDEKAHAALSLAPVLADLDQYELQVTGLAAGSYELRIDGEPAGKATSDELAKGWNIATQAGPITKQAEEVLKLVFKKNDLFYKRWRSVHLYVFPDWAQSSQTEERRAAELAKLDKQIAAAESDIDAARKPRTHRFELARATQ